MVYKILRFHQQLKPSDAQYFSLAEQSTCAVVVAKLEILSQTHLLFKFLHFLIHSLLDFISSCLVT